MTILILVLLGLCFGSFVNALVYRLHMQSKKSSGISNLESEKTNYRKQITENKLQKTDHYSITKGRSMCVHCKHELSTADLIPVLSWLALRGKCRYCSKPISWQYPAVETSTALLFVLSYWFWPYEISGWSVVSFGFWLAILVGFMALLVYDLRWMMLPSRIIYPLYIATACFVLSRYLAESELAVLGSAAIGTLIGGGIFYVLFQVSKGKWIGGGDVRLGYLLGGLAGTPALALLLLFIASVLGTIYSLPLMAAKKATHASKIPFGPFLILAAIIIVLFGEALIDLYVDYFIGGSI